MIQASHPASLWYPGKKLEGFGVANMSARAREIAKSREELLGLLQDLPESEFELSFTDLVEKSASTADDAPSNDDGGSLPGERETKRATAAAVKERKKMRRNSSSSGFGSSGSGGGGGVLLNMYMPSSLSRSLTTSRASRGAVSSKVAADCSKREKEPVMFGCLSGLWERGRDKSKKKVEERKRRSETKTVVKLTPPRL